MYLHKIKNFIFDGDIFLTFDAQVTMQCDKFL